MQGVHIPVLGTSAFLRSANTSAVTAVEMRSIARQDHSTCTLSPTCTINHTSVAYLEMFKTKVIMLQSW